jgi:hypothetical protein
MNTNDPRSLSPEIEAYRRAWGLAPDSKPVEPLTEQEEAERTRQLVRQQRIDRFNEFCPVEFRQKIDEAKIPNLAAWRAADSWNGAHPGLWLWSTNTGEAKTRMLWRKYGQLHVDQGKTVLRISGVNLSEAYTEAYHNSKTEYFYSRFAKMAVVMLDDIDKIPLSEEMQSYKEKEMAERNTRMLHQLFNMFYEWRKPVLVTANQNIAWFHERIGDSGARRIRSVCTEIEF